MARKLEDYASILSLLANDVFGLLFLSVLLYRLGMLFAALGGRQNSYHGIPAVLLSFRCFVT